MGHDNKCFPDGKGREVKASDFVYSWKRIADIKTRSVMWWLFDGPRAVGPFEGAYTARGAWGQWITVFPSLDLVIAHKTHNIYGRETSWESFEGIIELLFTARGVEMPGPYPWR